MPIAVALVMMMIRIMMITILRMIVWYTCAEYLTSWITTVIYKTNGKRILVTFWATFGKTVRRMLSDRCLSCPVCL